MFANNSLLYFVLKITKHFSPHQFGVVTCGECETHGSWCLSDVRVAPRLGGAISVHIIFNWMSHLANFQELQYSSNF
jgi:hypothetical protein